MTEAEWLACADPTPMLHSLLGKTSARKLSLFACACGRQVWHLMDDRRRKAIETTERYADGLSNQPARPNDVTSALGTATSSAALAREATRRADYLAAAAQRAATGRGPAPSDMVYPTGPNPEMLKQAALLREIVGNPYRPAAAANRWPPTVMQFASALYAGEDFSQALHGTLLALGHKALAEHFRANGHPRGCWALDAILGKK
ncbi:MAG: hypothetical protein K2R98_25945 [Gemmataceae bacterium]|nr:hypothetical protein [Gemmataceae bacterium]